MDARLGSQEHDRALDPAHDLLRRAVLSKILSRHPSPQDIWNYPATLMAWGILKARCSHLRQTAGYDGSMINGLNILPSYTDYFQLTPATTGLNTASIFIGGIIGPLFAGVISDRFGRRPTIFWGSLLTLLGVLLQTAAQHIAMFVIARIILGFGTAVSGVASGVYLSETFPSQYRAWGAGTLNNFYYVGALLAAGITLGTSRWQSTWAWRAPSLFQGFFSVLCILILPLIPESPRWLAYQGIPDAAKQVVAQTNSNGDVAHPITRTVYKEIVDTLAWEKHVGRTMSISEIWKTPAVRKRVLIGMSPGPFSAIVGNIIASYYLSYELDTAGITDSEEQLKAVSLSSTDLTWDSRLTLSARTWSSTFGVWPAPSLEPTLPQSGAANPSPFFLKACSSSACSSSAV